MEVLRCGAVVATIYGSREGIHIVSPLRHTEKAAARPFVLHLGPPSSTVLVVPLLRPEVDECPWCGGTGVFVERECPVCL